MLLILVFNVLVVLGSPTTLNLPEKLRQYQAVTGISGTQLLNIYKNSLAKRNSTSLGDQDNLFRTTNTFPGGDYFPTSEFPKFRLTGTAPSGDVHPVKFQREIFNVDAVIIGGTFLCTKPGYYHFSAAMSADREIGRIGLSIMHNNKGSAYARYLL